MNNLIDYINEVDKDEIKNPSSVSEKRSWNQEILGMPASQIKNPCNEILLYSYDIKKPTTQEIVCAQPLNSGSCLEFVIHWLNPSNKNLTDYIDKVDKEDEIKNNLSTGYVYAPYIPSYKPAPTYDFTKNKSLLERYGKHEINECLYSNIFGVKLDIDNVQLDDATNPQFIDYMDVPPKNNKINDSLFNEIKSLANECEPWVSSIFVKPLKELDFNKIEFENKSTYLVLDSVSSVFGRSFPEKEQIIEDLCDQITKEIDEEIIKDMISFYKKPYTFKKRKTDDLVSYINKIDREEE